MIVNLPYDRSYTRQFILVVSGYYWFRLLLVPEIFKYFSNFAGNINQYAIKILVYMRSPHYKYLHALWGHKIKKCLKLKIDDCSMAYQNQVKAKRGAEGQVYLHY